MTHEACRERLVDLAYGELSRREAAEVERHLAECQACRAERDRLEATVGAMRQLEAPPAPERGGAVLVAAARRAAGERRRDSFGLALGGFGARIAAGTAFALVAAFLLVSVRRDRLPPAEDILRAPAPAASRQPPPVASAPMSAPAESPPLRAGAGAPPSPAPAAAQPGASPRAERPAQELRKKARAPESAAPDRTASLSAPPAAALRREEAGEAAPARAAGDVASAEAEIGPRAKSAPRRAAEAPSFLAGAPAAPSASEPSKARAETGAPSQRPRPAPVPVGAGSSAREIERRHAAGELSDAQKRFEPCPGGDVRRTAWIDRQQRVLKLVRERADGVLVEEWFNEAGRLREALLRGRSASGPWVRHVTIGEDGEEEVQDATSSGLAPEVPLPALVRRDPVTAFFSGPGCDSAKRP